MAGPGTEIGDGGVLALARRSAVTVLAVRIAGAGLAYGTQVLFARLMGQADYGVFATVWVWIAILGHGSLWGVAQSVCRFVPEHRARGDLPAVRGFLIGGAAFTLVSSLAIAGLGGLVLWLLRPIIGEAHVWPLAAALLVLPLFALQDFVEGVARAFHWTGLAIAPPYLLRQGLIAAAMLASIAAGAPADPVIAVFCTLTATAISLVVQAGLLVRRVIVEIPAGPRRYETRRWAAASLPIALVDFTQLGLSFVDVILLGFFLPPEQVAVYFAATRILQFVVFVQYAASAATAQRFAEARAHGDDATLRALVAGTTRLTCLATLATGAAILAASPLLLALFGPGYAASVPPLAVLITGIMLASAFGPAEDLLTMLGHERLCAAIALAALGFAVCLALLLIPAFGVMGAAVATAGASAGRGLALGWAAHRRLGFATHVLGGARLA